MEKYNKISSKMHKYLGQQKVQQKVALLIKRFVFTQLVESLY